MKDEWKRFSEEKPPINTDVLVLRDGRIIEGYLDSVLLMGDKEPTIFQTLYNPSYFHAQHQSWGNDPYWMYIPFEKPIQEKREKSYDIICEA